ncbi:amino acid ABC transporter permease [Anaerolineales bacterium HSG25]|nr:amino acid ABC transporter permease [Anaerolineales bacterium HSG25]
MSKKSEASSISAEVVKNLPWWFIAIILLGVYFVILVFTNDLYAEVFAFVKDGVLTTIQITATAYAFSITIGMFTGLALVSKNRLVYNAATFYVQVIRGIPILVIILYIAFAGVPLVVSGINLIGTTLADMGLLGAENIFVSLQNRDISLLYRGVIALAISYGAFSAEIFRAGIQSIGHGQMEAAQSLGMSYIQAMRHIILPQAVRRVLPPLGNDLIAMLKESSLISALGVREITQMGKLYSAKSFEYLATYNVVAVLYLTMTVLLSLGVRAMEKRFRIN